MSVAKQNLKAALFFAKKNAELQADVRTLQKDIMQAVIAASDGREEIARLRIALARYSEASNWTGSENHPNRHWVGFGEGPDVARAALRIES